MSILYINRLSYGLFMLLSLLHQINPPKLYAAGRFGELIFSFPEDKDITYREDLDANALVLEFGKTSPEELSVLDNYDEKIIKRILIKDLGINGVLVYLYMKDQKLRATVDILSEPFRVAVNIFDKDYSQEIDPQSGLPLVGGQNLHTHGQERNLSLDDSSSMLEHSNQNQRGSQKLLGGRVPTVIEQLKNRNKRESQSVFQRKLLQPTPELIDSSEDLSIQLEKTAEGRGEAWQEFPFYIYPLQTAAYTGRKEPGGWKRKAGQTALSSAQSMAEFAYKMFSFGHEMRALFAYQQVLYKDPSVFDKDALHLWALAESHLGQANLNLADGYYDSLINKFPESPLSRFSYLRRLDIQSIKFIKNKNADQLADLAKPLTKLDTMGSGEIAAQKAIRLAYWLPPFPENFLNSLPLTNMEIRVRLESSFPNIESKKTAFLAASILLKNLLQEKESWKSQTAKLAGSYFSTYDEFTGKPFYKSLKNSFQSRLEAILIDSYKESKFTKAISIYENLPVSLREIKNTKEVAWSLAESYRNLDHDRSSLGFYNIVAKKSEKGPGRFKALFWRAILSEKASDRLRKTNSKQSQSLRRTALSSDRLMYNSWKGLSEKEKSNIRIIYKNHLEDNLLNRSYLKTPPRIILESWESALGSQVNAQSDVEKAGWTKTYSPTANTIRLLRDLIFRFNRLGLKKEWKKAAKLLQLIKPSTFQEDKEAQNIWIQQLLKLAEEYRTNNQYLEAGKLYSYTANESIDWENRAEALYKGGLLLYRAGKRQEAISTLTQASQDGNNLFYANLAKQRLVQLQQ